MFCTHTFGAWRNSNHDFWHHFEKEERCVIIFNLLNVAHAKRSLATLAQTQVVLFLSCVSVRACASVCIGVDVSVRLQQTVTPCMLATRSMRTFFYRSCSEPTQRQPSSLSQVAVQMIHTLRLFCKMVCFWFVLIKYTLYM